MAAGDRQTGGTSEMEENGSFRISPGIMALADLFGPLTTPTSALDFKDKVKITIKSNAGVKCLKVPNPCEFLLAAPPGGDQGRKEPKSCDVLKILLPGPTTGLRGTTAKPKPYLKAPPSSLPGGQESNKKLVTMEGGDLSYQARRSSATIHEASAHIKKEPRIGGAHGIKTPNKEASLLRKRASRTKTHETQSNYICVKEEPLPDVSVDIKEGSLADISVHIKEEALTDISVHIKEEPLPDVSVHIKEGPLTDISVHIKEEPLTDVEEPSDHMSHNIKKEPMPNGEDNLEAKDKPFHIKEEPFSDKEEDPSNIDETQIITVRIKEEQTSSEEEPEDAEADHMGGEPCSPQAGDPSKSKIWPPAERLDRILPRTLPLVIRNPQLTERKMALPKDTKMGLLKKLMETGTPAHETAQDMQTLTCTPLKMYQCSECRRYFTSRQHLKRHRLAHKKYNVACPDCGRLFACQATVLRHQVVHSKEKPFLCSFCDKSFSTDKGREIHQRRHTGDKPFVCPDCGKPFLFKAQLDAHRMIHTGERYSCDECGRCYRTKPGLVLHMRIHRGDVPYFCPKCGKGFVQKSNLRSHLHTHSEEKPFACAQCGRGFRQKYNLKQHMGVHAAKERKVYPCSECGKSYKRRADYRWHMLIHLGEK
ncbi:uncharacterized protein ACMZJ9_015373 [Mantella aurantiaca]